MSPYVFRHYDGTNDPKSPRRYNFLFDHDYRKHRKENSHHHHHHYYHNLDDIDDTGHRNGRSHHHPDNHRIHYLPTARSLPPLTYDTNTPRSPYRPNLEILKARSEEMSPARIAVEDRRRRWDRESNICYDYCPRKSSKAIPSMYYDKLRCPHCLAHVQPPQNQVQAYPWTEVSVRSRARRLNSQNGQDISYVGSWGMGSNEEYTQHSDSFLKPIEMRTESEPNSAARIETKTEVNASQRSNNGQTLTASLPIGRAQTRSIGAHLDRAPSQKTQSVVAPTSRMFGTREHIRGRKGTYREQIRDIHEDDIQPFDSVSNVYRPTMRAQSNRNIKGGYSPAHRGETETDTAYPRKRYFQSMRQQHPCYAPSTPLLIPRNRRDNRIFEGQYYDRRYPNLDINSVSVTGTKKRRKPEKSARHPHTVQRLTLDKITAGLHKTLSN